MYVYYPKYEMCIHSICQNEGKVMWIFLTQFLSITNKSWEPEDELEITQRRI